MALPREVPHVEVDDAFVVILATEVRIAGREVVAHQVLAAVLLPDGLHVGVDEAVVAVLATEVRVAGREVAAQHVPAAALPLEVLHAEASEAVVEVLSAKMRVTGSGSHLEDPVLNREGGPGGSAAAQVVDQVIADTAALRGKPARNSNCWRRNTFEAEISPATW